MIEMPAGFLVFVTSHTLTAVHQVASQLGRIKSGVHLLDVGLLTEGAWVAAWTKDPVQAARLAEDIQGTAAPISKSALQALFSLGPALNPEAKSIGILEATSTKKLNEFFDQVATCEKLGWTVLEIRVRKSGPSGAHAFFARSEKSQSLQLGNFTEIPVEGEYRKFF